MLNIALGFAVLFSGMTSDSAVTLPQTANASAPIVVIAPKEESENEIDKDVEAHVREYFSDIPIMIEVARCESHFTQFTKSGKVLRGRAVPEDVGVMQVNETYHLERSKKLGYDIYTLDGNLEYARHLYDELGARPWLASAPCWSKSQELAKK